MSRIQPNRTRMDVQREFLHRWIVTASHLKPRVERLDGPRFAFPRISLDNDRWRRRGTVQGPIVWSGAK